MSRLGKKPVPLGKASAQVNGRNVIISAGSNTLEFEHRPEITVALSEDSKSLEVGLAEGMNESVKTNRAYWGTTRALLANMVTGVTQGYEVKLEVVGVGYTAQMAGQKLDLKVGFANTISVPIPQGIDVEVVKGIGNVQFVITVKGADKQRVGQFAAVVKAKRPPEPYNGKGIKYANEVVRRKEGKAFGS